MESLDLKFKEGLAMINGTSAMAGGEIYDYQSLKKSLQNRHCISIIFRYRSIVVPISRIWFTNT